MSDTPLDAVVVAANTAASLGYVEEVSYGKTPPSPKLKLARRSTMSLSSSTEMYSSNEVNATRQNSDSRHGVKRAAGDVNIDLSPKSHADWYEALLGGYWQTPIAVPITTVNLTATLVAGLVEVTAAVFDFIAAGLYVGTPVTFTGAHADVNGKKFIVTGHAANKIILLPPAGFTLSGSPQALTTGTFHMKGARVGMGTVQRSFTMERAHADIGKFQVFNGMHIASFSADLPPTGVATGAFSLMGRGAQGYASASIDGVAQVLLDDNDMGQLVFNKAAGTITRQTGSWIADDFVVGDKAQFTGEGITEVQNRQLRTVTKVAETVLTVEEAIADGTYTADYYVLKVGVPAYVTVSDEDVLVAVSGNLLVNGDPAATITGMSISIDNQMDGQPIVGSNTIPFYSWGNQCQVTLSPTVYFGRGGAGEAMMNAAINEADVSIVLALDTKDGDDSMSFVFNRVLFAPGQIDDAAGGMTVSMEGTAAKPLAANPGHGDSQIFIFDTTVTGVAPPAAPLTLTGEDSGAGGIADFVVSGGVAPYTLDADDTGSTTDATVTKAGAFNYTYAGDGTYDPVITDATGATATVEIIITSAD